MSLKTIKKQLPSLIWKLDVHGNERPLLEQLARRKADLKIEEDHLQWYSNNPIRKNQLKRLVAKKKGIRHIQLIKKDIQKIELKIHE